MSSASRGTLLPALVVLALWLLVATVVSAERQRPGLDQSEWRDEVDKIDADLRAGKWKPSKRAANRVAQQVVRQSWYGVGLREVLSELAFQQAVAAANLGRRDEAVWFWLMAQNVDPRIRDKDFAPYGEAGKLLREFPLRRKGEVPARFRVVRPSFTRIFKYPRPIKGWYPTIPLNAAAKIEGVGDLKVELIVDKEGKPHHPVLVSTYQHPVVVYGALDALRTMPPFAPATDNGEVVDSIFEFTANFEISRWDQGGKLLDGKLN